MIKIKQNKTKQNKNGQKVYHKEKRGNHHPDCSWPCTYNRLLSCLDTEPYCHRLITEVKQLYSRHFCLKQTLFEAGGAVFIINSKIHLRKISFNAYFNTIFGLNSVTGSTADRCTELKPVFDPSVTTIGGKGPIHCEFVLVIHEFKGVDFREGQRFDSKKLN